MKPFWVSAFLDFAPEHFDEGVRFWSALTTYDVSASRGVDGEFATLLPPDGDDFLRVQRLGDGPDRIHLDLHVSEPRPAADRATRLGATEVADRGYVVMTSPAGVTFCFVSDAAGTRPRPREWPAGHTSLLDQVCIDIPKADYEAECAFWSELTGWGTRASSVSPEFRSLVRPAGHPLRFLLQRIDEGPVGAHFDWATSDRPAETARHEELGARVEAAYSHWTVLTDPLGRRYCITDRHPETGLPPGT